MKYFLVGALTILIGLSSQVAQAKPVSLIGEWSGSGVAKGQSGKRGQTRCQIAYTKGSGRDYGVLENCMVSRIGAITQTAKVRKISSNRYSGKFHNYQHSVSGKITIVVIGGKQRVTMTSERGTASLTLAKN